MGGCQAKIRQSELQFFHQQDILGLEITMADPTAMTMFNSVQELQKQVAYFAIITNDPMGALRDGREQIAAGGIL
jgi:hypothetical protein